jgi:hypothetical protein
MKVLVKYHGLPWYCEDVSEEIYLIQHTSKDKVRLTAGYCIWRIYYYYLRIGRLITIQIYVQLLAATVLSLSIKKND